MVIDVTCPYCDLKQRVRLDKGNNLITCDSRCDKTFVANLKLTPEVEVYRLVKGEDKKWFVGQWGENPKSEQWEIIFNGPENECKDRSHHESKFIITREVLNDIGNSSPKVGDIYYTGMPNGDHEWRNNKNIFSTKASPKNNLLNDLKKVKEEETEAYYPSETDILNNIKSQEMALERIEKECESKEIDYENDPLWIYHYRKIDELGRKMREIKS